MGRHAGNQGGRPPLAVRKPRKKAPQTALTVAREENAAVQPRDDGAFTSPYSDQDKQLAMTLYAITGSPTRAAEWWARVKGTEDYPSRSAIKAWGDEGVLPSEEAVNALKAVYRGRFLDQEIETLELAHIAVRGALGTPNKNLYYLNGVLMTTADRTRQVLYPAQKQSGNIINMPGARFNVGEGYEPPVWEGEK